MLKQLSSIVARILAWCVTSISSLNPIASPWTWYIRMISSSWTAMATLVLWRLHWWYQCHYHRFWSRNIFMILHLCNNHSVESSASITENGKKKMIETTTMFLLGSSMDYYTIVKSFHTACHGETFFIPLLAATEWSHTSIRTPFRSFRKVVPACGAQVS